MGRCPWNGEQCDCGLGWPYPDQDGVMPKRCEDRTTLDIVAMYVGVGKRQTVQVSAAKKAEYDRWVAAGQPRLHPEEPDELVGLED